MTDYTKLVEALRYTAKAMSAGKIEVLRASVLIDAADAIEALQAQLPKRGEWVDRYDEHDKPFFKRKYVCSACGNWNTYGKSNYCPKCGAKMEVQE